MLWLFVCARLPRPHGTFLNSGNDLPLALTLNSGNDLPLALTLNCGNYLPLALILNTGSYFPLALTLNCYLPPSGPLTLNSVNYLLMAH